MNRAFGVAQHDRPEVDGFDQPADAVDRRDVADPHLVFENQEETADHVAHQRLRAEADRQAENAGAGQERRDVQAEGVQHHQQRHAAERDGHDLVDDGSQRSGALGALERIERRAAIQLVLEARDQQRRDADQRIAEDDRREQRAARS